MPTGGNIVISRYGFGRFDDLEDRRGVFARHELLCAHVRLHPKQADSALQAVRDRPAKALAHALVNFRLSVLKVLDLLLKLKQLARVRLLGSIAARRRLRPARPDAGIVMSVSFRFGERRHTGQLVSAYSYRALGNTLNVSHTCHDVQASRFPALCLDESNPINLIELLRATPNL
jgi:hypothetical protein